jgi:hypothetical protein
MQRGYEMKKILMVLAMVTMLSGSVKAQRIRYWIEPNGKMADISSAETHRRIDQAMGEMMDICDITFERVTDFKRARVRFFFRPQNQIPYGALGLAYTRKKYILLNSTRKIGLNTERGDRYVQSVAQHEMLHMLRWKHSDTEGSIMHPYSIPKFFNRTDVWYLQKKFGKYRDRVNNETGAKGRKNRDGKPDRLFTPPTLIKASQEHKVYLDEHERLWDIRRELIAERDASTNEAERAYIQAEILRNHAAIVANKIPLAVANTKWHLINNYWVGAYGFTNTYK